MIEIFYIYATLDPLKRRIHRIKQNESRSKAADWKLGIMQDDRDDCGVPGRRHRTRYDQTIRRLGKGFYRSEE